MMDAERKEVGAMGHQSTVLLFGGTGRTGGRVLEQLLERGVAVRVVVRSAERLPAGVADHPDLTVTVAELLTQSDEELARQVEGCDAVISCLGHTLSAGGLFGKPRDLIERVARNVCRAVETTRRERLEAVAVGLAGAGQTERAAATPPEPPVRLILLSAPLVDRPGRLDARRGSLERTFLGVLRGLVPAARDNQRAADFLVDEVGADGGPLEWAAIRPGALRDGGITEYTLHEGPVDILFRPGRTNMANVAHFMCELATDDQTWATWRGKLPVIVNTPSVS